MSSVAHEPNSEDVKFFHANGYLLSRRLFSESECDALAKYFTDMVERGGDGWAEGVVDPHDPDPLKRYPRLLQPHRGDKVAFDFMVDERIRQQLNAFYGRDPWAVQTMIYFKPPGARGQALHQDQRYLRAEPGTCMAAWLALDDIDEENGCLEVVPSTHDLPMICPGGSDSEKSFTHDEIHLPVGMVKTPIQMNKGDMLFFNGSLVHGSGPNLSKDRFRRIIVGHYIEGESEKVGRYYFPVYRFDGSIVEGLAENPQGGPCGLMVERDGKLVYELTGAMEGADKAH